MLSNSKGGVNMKKKMTWKTMLGISILFLVVSNTLEILAQNSVDLTNYIIKGWAVAFNLTAILLFVLAIIDITKAFLNKKSK